MSALRRAGEGGGFELRLGRTRLCLHPLTLLLPPLAMRLGLPGEARALLLGLAVHEGAHLLAARLLGVRVKRLTLLPFGGTMDVGNPYAMAPGRLFALALAGPLGNLAAILAAAGLAQAGLVGGEGFLRTLEANLSLLLFNLLPALPLDGGRMLFALLSPRLGRPRAARAGVFAGYAVAALLAVLALLGWRQAGRLNLSPLIAAAFLVAAAPRELRALTDTRVETLLNALRPAGAPVEARVVAVGSDCPVRDALRAASPDAVTLYAVYDGLRLTALSDDRQLLSAAAGGRGELPVGEAGGARKWESGIRNEE